MLNKLKSALGLGNSFEAGTPSRHGAAWVLPVQEPEVQSPLKLGPQRGSKIKSKVAASLNFFNLASNNLILLLASLLVNI